MSKQKKVLGIDPGFGRVGLGLILKSGQKIEYLDAHTIETDASLDFYERLGQIQDELDQYLDLHQPDGVVIEKLYFTKNVTTAINVAEACGVIGLLVAKRGIVLQKLTPTQMKMALTGNGKANKKEVQMMVERILKNTPDFKNILDDAVDGLAMAMAL